MKKVKEALGKSSPALMASHEGVKVPLDKATGACSELSMPLYRNWVEVRSECLASVGIDEGHPTWGRSQRAVGSAGTLDRTLADAPVGRRRDLETPIRHRRAGHRDTGGQCHPASRDTRMHPVPYTPPRRYRTRFLQRSRRLSVSIKRRRG
jgi:hypothetical protein